MNRPILALALAVLVVIASVQHGECRGRLDGKRTHDVGEFEEAFAHSLGVEHVVGVNSGTDALLLALMAYGVGPGDAIFTSPFTFISTAEVISLVEQAYATGDFEGVKNLFEHENEMGCPLN